MPRRQITIEKYCRDWGIDPEDAMLVLWDEGYSSVTSTKHRLSQTEVNVLSRRFAMPKYRKLSDVKYVVARFGLSNEEERHLMQHAKKDGRIPLRLIRKLVLSRTDRAGERLHDQVDEQTTLAKQDYPWRTIGASATVRNLSVEEVLTIHSLLTEDFKTTDDPIVPEGVRQQSLLESALFRPMTSIGDTLKYPTIEMATAALMYGIVHNHPFHNGNKRTAMVAGVVLLDKHRIVLTCDDNELFRMMLQLARHAMVPEPYRVTPDAEMMLLAEWIKRNTRQQEKGDRELPWRTLKAILQKYGCSCEKVNQHSRQSMHVTRTVQQPRRGLFTSRSPVILQSNVDIKSESGNAPKSTIKKLRVDLELDEKHGVDSYDFYDSESTAVQEFILQYRNTLRQLAKYG